MGKALYRSYRSKTFDEVKGQSHITETLKNSIKNKSFVHAYLLTGPRGVGKTSVARILAHAVNGVEYPSSEQLVDIVEIDAASNRRIDEIRELRERVAIAPSKLKYKVYIIDEVHMLTREAFNALLKTLEEPPDHVIFILATTDFHKVPETIASRCVRFQFKPISPQDIFAQLKTIAKKEKIEITDEALKLLAAYSDGSFRDGIALLDQISARSRKIDEKEVRQSLGLGSFKIMQKILENITGNDAVGLLRSLEEAYSDGANESRLCSQLQNECRSVLFGSSESIDKKTAMQLSQDLLEVSSYDDTRSALEVALLKNTFNEQSASNTVVTETKPSEDNQTVTDTEQKPKEIQPVQTNTDFWPAVLEQLKERNRSLYSIARMANATLDNDTLRITFSFAFHHKQANQSKNKKILMETAQSITPNINSIQIEIDEKNEQNKTKNSEPIDSISNIFGASEVLES